MVGYTQNVNHAVKTQSKQEWPGRVTKKQSEVMLNASLDWVSKKVNTNHKLTYQKRFRFVFYPVKRLGLFFFSVEEKLWNSSNLL